MVAEVVDGEELTSDLIPGLKQSRKIPLVGTEGNTGIVPVRNGLSPPLVGQFCTQGTPETVKQDQGKLYGFFTAYLAASRFLPLHVSEAKFLAQLSQPLR